MSLVKTFIGQAVPGVGAQKYPTMQRRMSRTGTEAVSTSKERSEAGASSSLPLKEIPGSYGLPFFGAIKDRFDFFWFQGADKFFQSRIQSYGSTVFRVNIPPGPPGFPDPRVVMLCDQKSFPVLFDMERVDKVDVFTGTYMPSTSFTGGYRVLPYLDPSEERHTKLKSFCFDILQSNGKRFLPEFHTAITEAYAVLEAQLLKDGKADFKAECAQFTFDFLMRSIVHRDPAAPGENSLGTGSASLTGIWIALQLLPIAPSGVLPHIVDELLLHSFPLPFWPAKANYDKLYNFINTYATDMLDIAVNQRGLEREDACHNLLFFICFNAHGGFNILFPAIIKYIGDAGAGLQKELADEVRAVVKDNGGIISMKAIEEMKLVKSVVYETLRIEPPVPYQYGRAKKDFIIESHDASFQVKKGELLGGAQPVATKDPKVFSDPNTFEPKRFLGEEGQKLLQYVLWSNGPETGSTAVANKQCAGKDFVIFVSNLFLAEFFLRYDSFELSQPSSSSAPTFTMLKVASS